MPQRKRRKRLEAKYVYRRFFMLFVLLAALVGGGVALGMRLTGSGEPSQADSKSSQSQESQPTAATEAKAAAPEAMAASPSSHEEEGEAGQGESQSEPEAGQEEGQSEEEARGGEEDGESEEEAELTEEERLAAEEEARQQAKQAAANEKLRQWNLVIVNRDSSLPSDFQVSLETVVDDTKVDARIREPLLRMLASARETGIMIKVAAGYQGDETLNDNNASELEGATEYATGLAVDFVTGETEEPTEAFARTEAYRWLQEHAAAYGFILRYPENKQSLTGVSFRPWHYRYVGVEEARLMNKMGYCLEEYIYVLNTGGIEEPEESLEDEGDRAE